MPTSDKILDLPAILRRIASWRVHGEQIVFSNGCFDLLHLGHVDYLEKARQFGDRLVVGLNTDASVRDLKGPERPLVSERARARVIAALEFVDGVVLFGEETPKALIEAISPDILVKGADYEIHEIVGHEWVLGHGGRVERIELVEGFSTSSLVEKLRG